MNARSLMTENVAWISPEAPVAEAARQLASAPPGVTCLLVGDGDEPRVPVGVLTAADILRAALRTALAPGRLDAPCATGRPLHPGDLACEDLFRRMAEAAGRTRVRDVMSSPVVCAEEGTTASQLADTLVRNRIESMPVCSGGRVVGIVHRRALLRALSSAMENARA